jgi:hypothetical protein
MKLKLQDCGTDDIEKIRSVEQMEFRTAGM